MNWQMTLWGLVTVLVLAVVQLQREVNAIQGSSAENLRAYQELAQRFLREEAIIRAAERQDVNKSMDQLNAVAPDYAKPLHWPEAPTP